MVSKRRSRDSKGSKDRVQIFSLDPSINRVGWARIANLQRDEEGVWNADEAKWDWGYWDLSSQSLSFKAKELVDFMSITFEEVNPERDILIAEYPQYFDQMRGQIAAKEGHTQNLAALDFYVFGYFRFPWNHFFPVFPSQWKGNLKKDITRMRFFREIGVPRHYRLDHNTVDAAMMLLWWCKTHGVTNKIINYSVETE